MTDYTKLPDNVLRLIITNLKNDLEENDIDINDTYHTFEGPTLVTIDEALQYFLINTGKSFSAIKSQTAMFVFAEATRWKAGSLSKTRTNCTLIKSLSVFLPIAQKCPIAH
jgi:hypothetical protein